MLRIDLHTHSVFSDGTLTIDELVSLAKIRRISVLSLTDHDSVSGIESFLKQCNKHKIRGVAGIELSAEYPGVLHILGYRFDYDKLSGCSLFNKIRDSREERNAVICNKLKNAGIDISINEIYEESKQDIVARPHIARFLVKKGYASNINEAFTKYLKAGGIGYASRFRVDPEKCVSIIRENGGLPVLAHPWQTSQDMFELRKLVSKLKDFGLWGIECYSNSNNSARVYDIIKLAGEIGLYVTGGSDYHGDIFNDDNLGVLVPDDILPWARFCGGL
ncbi:MAG: PHP domain-containing protein [Synergistaceae bacterium]|nr:PHP domain-containing protein [Synergistaceae bacterium]